MSRRAAARLAFAAGLAAGASGCTTTSRGGGSPTPAGAPSATGTRAHTHTPSSTPTQTPTGVPTAYLVVAAGAAVGLTSSVYVGTLWTNGDVTGWTAATPLPDPVAYAAMAVAAPGGFLYLAGGDAGGTASDGTLVAATDAAGAVTAWTTGITLPQAVTAASCASDGAGHLYLAGGYDHYDFSNTLSSVSGGSYGAGSFSSFSAGIPLPQSAAEGALAYAAGRLYLAGGYAGTSRTSAVRRATAAGGSVGAWVTLPQSLPAALSGCAGFSIPGRIFVAGGTGGGPAAAGIYSASVDGAGGIPGWVSSASPMPEGKAAFSAAVVPLGFAGFLYVAGGWTGAVGMPVRADVYVAPFGSGSLGAWSSTLPLPGPREGMAAAL